MDPKEKYSSDSENLEIQEYMASLRTVDYDYMTGLPNMAYFFELARTGLKKMREQNIDSAIIFFDMTGLKRFNRWHGFTEGNRLIRAVAAVLSEHFGNENCSHFAQDYFAAFAPEDGLEERLKAVITDCAGINEGKSLPLRIGVYPNRIETVGIDAACDRARLAANVRKKSKESYYSFFDMNMLVEENNRQEIIDNLDRAIEEGWIQVYYQPIVRSVNGKVCNAEALARWKDPVRGMLMPATFISVLEEAMLIHKLDLCVVRQVVKDLVSDREKGNRSIPISINFSRADFEACDLVHEICKITDEAKIDRKLINIEITESVVGKDFEYMKAQVDRFHAHGFQVWMDDFGSGYSSLDVLQSIKFDLIKFDMGFLKKLDEGNAGKIILTEMTKMATSLEVDTLCEGVETEEQFRFLQEIGCSKLQGYYFCKPMHPDDILEKYGPELQHGFENPAEAHYYDSVGRLNLYDLSFLANMDSNIIKNTFDTVPMGIIEMNSESTKVRYIRSNHSFREFIKRSFGLDISDPKREFPVPLEGSGSIFMKTVRECRYSGGSRAFLDEKLPDGSVIHSFIRIIESDPLTGSFAFAVAVLSIREPGDNTTYADIAGALAADYYNLFVIDLDTNDFTEYSSQVGGEEMTVVRHGEDFFESAKRDTMTRIYEEDRETFLKWFTRENVLRELDTQGVFTTTYRLIDTGTPVYVNMKITRMHDGNRLILGISIIDAQMKQLEEEKKLRQEKIALGRIASLSPDYIVLYMVDPETWHYTQYNPSNEFERFGLAMQGEDFFRDVVIDAPKAIDPEDIERHLRVFTKENVMKEIQKNGFYIHNYRLLMNGKSVPVSLRATMIEEDGGNKLLLGVLNDEKEEYSRGLEAAYEEARSVSIIKTHIAEALARGCTDLFYVNMDSNELIEYHTEDDLGVLAEARRGTDFFESCERDAKLFVYPDDQDKFVKAMDRDFLEKELDKSRIFEMTYRRIKNGRSFYVKMRVSRVEEDKRFIVIAVFDIDEQMKQRMVEERLIEERIIYARLHAITGNFICVYLVDPDTGNYREFSATDDYSDTFSQAKEGTDFFNTLRDAVRIFSHPSDMNRVLSLLTQENVLSEIAQNSIFTLGYRIMMDGKPRHIQLKAAMVEEKEGPRLIVGLNDIDVQVRQEEEFIKRLEQARSQVNIDALTKIKNKHAYLEEEAHMNRRISRNNQMPFAIVILDVNDLKKVNDSSGHQAGDQYLCDACKIICETFKHSPVFRVGGDEFAVIARGLDYSAIEDRLNTISEHNKEALRTGGIIIACGMSRFENDQNMAQVYARADQNMYENKKELKASRP